ncbi:MAG: LysR family transcriptional regulator [Rubrivivax sp.]|nr:MAG: LysR family transcriptional regulator [Rubrivivax sp.]
MNRRPPPLQWLPAFEATARLLSFSKAATEMHLTASAISQQVKLLEDHIGLALFRRLTRRIELTEAGVAFARLATKTLSVYRHGHTDLLEQFSRPVLRISMFPMVAHELILPALSGFQEAHPGMDLRLETGMDLADFEQQPLDAAIRFGLGHWPGLEALPLSDCQGTLVAAPDLIKRLPVDQVEDLRHHTLIHPRGTQMDWDAAAAFVGLDRIPRKGDLMLDTDLGAMRAAEQGLGVALAILPIVRPWIDAGRLVALVPPNQLPMKNYFVFRQGEGEAKREQLMLAYQWIKGLFDALSQPG